MGDVVVEREGRVGILELSRPDRLNALSAGLLAELRAGIDAHASDPEVRVILLRGAGRAFCAGYDLDWGTELEASLDAGGWDPVRDYLGMSRNVETFMAMWRCPKPVIAQVHGWCVGGGTDLVLCADLIVTADDARIGYPPARVWGSPTTALWTYRLGPERAKRLLLTGDAITGAEAERWGLCCETVPSAELGAAAMRLAERVALLPANQLTMMKLLVNLAVESMGVAATQLIGTIFDGIARHTPEGIAWRDLARREGVKAALAERDGPFGDYGARPR